jgi:hypothetical protein
VAARFAPEARATHLGSCAAFSWLTYLPRIRKPQFCSGVRRLLARIPGLADADIAVDAGCAAFAESCVEAEQRDERLTARQRYVAGDSGDGPGEGSFQH